MKKKEFCKMFDESWFWAWRRLKDRTSRDEDPAPDIADAELVEIMIESVIPKQPTRGDGRYDRVVNYMTHVCETLEWLKRKWRGDQELLNAFMLGMEVSCEALRREIQLIDHKPLKWNDEEWRKP
jgi:hypothetical protein